VAAAEQGRRHPPGQPKDETHDFKWFEEKWQSSEISVKVRTCF
jgi:hypothetical protein